MDLDFHPYKEQDYAEQRKLFELSFPETAQTSLISNEHYDWKFKSFAANPPSYQYVATDEQLVGYYAALPYKYKIGSQVLRCGMVCDVMTHPQRRGKGIFTKLGQYATDQMRDEGLDFTSGYPIRPEVIPGHLKVGWQVVVKMPMYLRLLGLRSFLPAALKWTAFFVNPCIRWAQFSSNWKDSNYRCEVLSREVFLKSTAYSEFLQTWLAEQENALIKDLDFLAWRTQAPQTQYHFFVLFAGAKMVGFSLARGVALKGIASFAVLDFMVLKNHLAGAKTLHQHLKKMALERQDDVVVCMATPTWAKKYGFKKNFYFPTPAVFSLIIKKLKDFPESSLLFKKESWHLFWIDSDDL